MMIDYAFEPRTLAGLDQLEEIMGMGQLPCCPPGTTSTPANPCYDCPPGLYQLYAWSAPSATPPVTPPVSTLGTPTGSTPCTSGLADPTLVSLFGPCTVQTYANGQQTIAYGGIPLNALPTAPPLTGISTMTRVGIGAAILLLAVAMKS